MGHIMGFNGTSNGINMINGICHGMSEYNEFNHEEPELNWISPCLEGYGPNVFVISFSENDGKPLDVMG